MPYPPSFEAAEVTPEIEFPFGDHLEPVAEAIDLARELLGDGPAGDFVKNPPRGGLSLADTIELYKRWYENDRNMSNGDYIIESIGDIIDVINPLTGDDLSSGEIPDWIEEIFPPEDPTPPSPPPSPVPEFPRGCTFSLFMSGFRVSSGQGTRTATVEEDPNGFGFTFPADVDSEPKIMKRTQIWSYNLADYHEVRVEPEYGAFYHHGNEEDIYGEIFSVMFRVVNTLSGKVLISKTLSSTSWLEQKGFNNKMGGFTVRSAGSSEYRLEVVPRASEAARCRWSPPPKAPPKPKPPPPPDDDDDDMKCNCRNLEDMLRKLCAVTGVTSKDLPAGIPNLRNSSKTTIRTIPGLIAHFYSEFDGVFGQFPMEVEIEDVDPTTKEKEEEKIKYPNLSEMIADIFSVLVQTNQGVSLIGAGIPRLAVEIVAAKNAAIVGESYARANAGYLGYQSQQTEVKVGYAFDLEEKEDKALLDIYQNSEGKLILQTESDKSSVAEALGKILLATEILKATSTRSGPQVLEMLDEIFRLRRIVKGGGSDSIDNLLNTINDSSFYKGGDTSARPAARRISEDELEDFQSGWDAWD
jgi:hypothetical protein